MAKQRILDMDAPLRAIGYTRVSTRKQVDSGLSLAAQRRTIADEATKRGWELVATHTDEGKTAKTMSREGIRAALEALRKREADVLVVPKQDRATRSMRDFAELVETAKKQGWRLVDLDFDVDTTTPMGEAMAYQKAIFAQLERRLISERTKVALAELKTQGVQLGKPSKLPQSTIDLITELKTSGQSIRKICAKLNDDQVPTTTGAAWHPTTVARVLERATAAA